MLKPTQCFQPVPCPLAQYVNKSDEIIELGTSFTIPEGEGTLGVALVGEGAGHEEAVDGLPFRPKAQAGSQLEDAFRRLGYKRSQFRILNIIQCQPPANLLDGMWYGPAAIEHCMKAHTIPRIESFHTPHTKVLVALGNVPLVALTGVSGLASEKQSISNLRGYIFNSKWGWVVPAYHPSYIKRGNPHLTPTLVEDLRKAVRIAQGKLVDFQGSKDWQKPNYQTSPSLDDAWSYYYRAKDNEKLIISYDIETMTSAGIDEEEREEISNEQIETIQFSLGEREGIFMPFEDEYKTIAYKMMELPNRKIGHNVWFFDNPIMKAAGFKFGGGLPIDLMWLFKHWHPRLQRGLQSVASLFDFPFCWKHLFSSDFEFYGCADVDAPQWILPRLQKAMKEKGVWQGFVEQIYQVHPIMSKCSERGIPVSLVRHEQLGSELAGQLEVLDGDLQRLVPDELKNITPKRKVG